MLRKREGAFEYALAFLVMVGFGSMGVFVRWAGLKGQEQYVVFWRILIGLGLLLMIVLLSGRAGALKLRDGYLLLLLNSSAYALQSYSSTKAVYLLPLKDAIFIIYLAPVLVAIMAPLLLKEKLEKVTVLALIVSLGGLALMSFTRGGGEKASNMTGVAYALLAACSYSVLIITLKALRERLPALTVLVYANLLVLLMTLPFVRFHAPDVGLKGWTSLAVMGLLHAGVLALLYVYVARTVKAQHLGILAYIDPVTATILGMILFGETPAWQDFLGAALIITGGAMVLLAGASTAGASVTEEGT